MLPQLRDCGVWGVEAAEVAGLPGWFWGGPLLAVPSVAWAVLVQAASSSSNTAQPRRRSLVDQALAGKDLLFGLWTLTILHNLLGYPIYIKWPPRGRSPHLFLVARWQGGT